MNINKNNYEAFFLDYHEGNLSPEESEAVLFFVEQYPELKEEFEGFENFMLEDFSFPSFENKEILKKEITVENKEEYFIKSLENTLNKAETELLNNFLKLNPQFLGEFELFQKTKILADDFIIFENKNELKKDVLSFHSSSASEDGLKNTNEAEEIFIEAVEGLLSKEKQVLFNFQLSNNAEAENNLRLFKQTILKADTSIKFENKESLKHRQRKTIPLFYYAAAIAASVLLLFGLFFLFNNSNVEHKFAGIKHPVIKQKEAPARSIEIAVNKEKINTKKHTGHFTSPLQKETAEIKMPVRPDSLFQSPNEESKDAMAVVNKNNGAAVLKDTVAAVSSATKHAPSDLSLAIINPKKNETAKSDEFVSLGQAAVEKIKEKLLDKNSIASQKKSNRLKKINGWDIAQMVTSGIRKLTGRKLEVKPYYNNEGDVTAYAVSAGRFQISSGNNH